MAAPWNPPVRAEDFRTFIALESYANPGTFQSNPTIAAGDFQVSKDGGAFANLTTLPSVAPASSEMVQIDLSGTEMTADVVVIRCKDQTSPPEWAPLILTINTTA